MWFYEYDYSIGTTGAFHRASSPGNSTVGSSFFSSSFKLYLLDLPDGNILFCDNGDQSGQLYVYQPDTPPLASGKPTIYSVSWNADGSLHLSGTLFNGITQGASFGDDAMVQSGGTQNWFRLTPDSTGGYTNGTWTNLAPMGYNRFGYASVVLRDGRVMRP